MKRKTSKKRRTVFLTGLEQRYLSAPSLLPGSLISSSLTATSNATVLQLGGDEVPSWDDLDNVSVTGASSAVPEPASLTLLGIGIAGLTGYGWRRRKQQVANA